MIRDVKPQDATAITKIYNEYITNSIISFETEPLTEEDMLSRILQISSKYPYLVYETGGIVVGYCYAHAWKERAAYRYTAETTVLFISRIHRQRHRDSTHAKINRRVP